MILNRQIKYFSKWKTILYPWSTYTYYMVSNLLSHCEIKYISTATKAQKSFVMQWHPKGMSFKLFREGKMLLLNTWMYKQTIWWLIIFVKVCCTEFHSSVRKSRAVTSGTNPQTGNDTFHRVDHQQIARRECRVKILVLRILNLVQDLIHIYSVSSLLKFSKNTLINNNIHFD